MIATETKSSNELESSNGQKSAMTDGFHLIVDALKLNGIDTIYGVAGIPITDLARLAQAEGIRFIGFRHEQSAGNAADRKSTRLNSSHLVISYAVFCLKKKKKTQAAMTHLDTAVLTTNEL